MLSPAFDDRGEADSAMQSNRRIIEQLVLPAVLLVMGIVVFWDAAHHAPYHVDEGDYVYTARYFDYLVVQRDLGHEAWGDNLWTRTQPMLTRYIVGGWLWTRGHNLSTLPPPGSDLPEWFVVEARAVSVVFAACCLVLLYLIGHLAAGSVAGVVAAALLLLNPITRDHLARVIPEPFLIFFVLLSLWLAMAGMQRGQNGSLPPGWSVAAGLALGLAFQSKLTAIFSFAVFGAWALIAGGAAFWRSERTSQARALAVWRSAGGWLLAIAVGLAVFVVTNPHLYPDPLGRTRHLFGERQTTMASQRGSDPEAASGHLLDRVAYVTGGSLVAPVSAERDDRVRAWHGVPLALILAPIGVLALLRRSLRHGGRSLQPGPSGLIVLAAFGYLAGIALTIQIEWYRYVIPAYVLTCVIAGIGAATIVGVVRTFRIPGRV